MKRAHEGLFHQRRKREERGRGNPIQVWLLQGMTGKEEGSEKKNRKRQTPMKDVLVFFKNNSFWWLPLEKVNKSRNEPSK